MDASSTAQAQHPSQISSKQKDWTCFDESPVHLQSPNPNIRVSNQASWEEGIRDARWTNFENSNENLDSNVKANTSQPISPESALPTSQHTSFKFTETQAQHKETSNLHPSSGLELSSSINMPINPPHPSSFSNSTTVAAVNLSTSSAISHQPSNPTVSLSANNHPRVSTTEDSDYTISNHLSEVGSDHQDPWCIMMEQRQYYTNQFASMQPDIKGKIDDTEEATFTVAKTLSSPTARDFFTKSKLPIVELSHVWKLSDMDEDGHLSLDEFCIAFHLVVARMNKYDLPSQLPQSLVPRLIDIHVESEEHQVADAQMSEKRVDQWETFSDRTASSTTLANFDQVPDSNQDIHHPVAQRMTPSRHQEHWSKMESGNLKVETLDDGSTTSSPQAYTKKHHPLTNPYECLRNDFSGLDGSDLERHKARRSSVSSSSSSSSEPTRSRIDPSVGENVFKRSIRSRVSVEAQFSDDEKPHDDEHSDHDHSDWASRPLRPRSSSNSSEDSVAMPSIAAPQPPPRPQIHIPSSTVSPLPKPRSSDPSEPQPAKTSDTFSHLEDSEMRFDGPTPPPRPAISKPEPFPVEQASFADFSNFNPTSPTIGPADPQGDSSTGDAAKTRKKSTHKKETKGEVVTKVEKKAVMPNPVPRSKKKAVKSAGKETKNRGRDVINASSKKAPTKPPRSRIMSADMIRADHGAPSLITSKKKDAAISAAISAATKQKFVQRKLTLQTSIRDLKSRNTQLSRLNADLQQQLKDVMETRITVEMAIHQMRPFSQ